ncbi:hypothetical protein TNCT_543331 [Trichonephila clavata]|uniref:Uncharacterized protein n=1 Tax=Trichonephila clavata TaxID=2740835 RepID=A0A8X6M022_TRICU|nr:hypothetical protein TNCT_543331 [Trichonephila clavata]
MPAKCFLRRSAAIPQGRKKLSKGIAVIVPANGREKIANRINLSHADIAKLIEASDSEEASEYEKLMKLRLNVLTTILMPIINK